MATKAQPNDWVKDCSCHQQGKCNECKAAKQRRIAQELKAAQVIKKELKELSDAG